MAIQRMQNASREALRQLQLDIALHLQDLERLGDDVYEDGDVLRFDVRWPHRRVDPDHTFRYAAVKAVGRWWLTGRDLGNRSAEGCSWDTFVQWLLTEDKIVESVWLMRPDRNIFAEPGQEREAHPILPTSEQVRNISAKDAAALTKEMNRRRVLDREESDAPVNLNTVGPDLGTVEPSGANAED